MSSNEKIIEILKRIWHYIRFVVHYTRLLILKLLRFVLFTLTYFGVTIGIIGLIVAYIKIYPIYLDYDATTSKMIKESNAKTFEFEEPSFIYDNSGEVLIKLKGNQDSTYLQYKEIPKNVINAFVAVEDRSFWENPGIDIKGLVRVGVDAIKTKGDELHGASTITQQLARNIFLTHEVSLERKAKEMLLAIKMTKKYSKEDIMEFYINDICFANAIYGIESASKAYFGKSVNELTLSEQVYLCAIPNSPSYYDPYKYTERALVRRDKMLGDMLELGYITQDEYDKAIKQEIVITRTEYEFSDYQTTYAIECAVKYIMKKDGFAFKYEFDTDDEYDIYKKSYSKAYEDAKNKLYTQGYHIYTSLDDVKQEILQSAIDEKLKFSNSVNDEGIYEFQGAATLIDNMSGKVVAIVGGRSQEQKTYSLNRAYQSYRQPGSSIKPLIVYAPAIDNGYNEKSTLANISIEEAKEEDAVVSELNGNKYNLRYAVTKSLNGCAWWLFDKVTPDVGLKYITDMKFENIVPDDYYLASSLGGFTKGVTTVEMAGAYATLVNHGEFREPNCIISIKDSSGNEIYKEEKAKKIYERDSSNIMIDVMQDVVSKGTASSMRWSRSSKVQAAGKTGTTNGGKDGWFCGVTPYYSLAVWVGYDIPKELDNLYGGTYPAEIWKSAMLGVLDVSDTSDNKKFEENVLQGNIGALEWNEYLPGRADDEVISENYTVADYRQDHILADSARVYINDLLELEYDKVSYYSTKVNLYFKAKDLISQIYSKRLYESMSTELETAYNQPVKQPDNVTTLDELQNMAGDIINQTENNVDGANINQVINGE